MGDQAFQDWWGRFERMGANPAGAAHIMKVNRRIRVEEILPSVRVPTLVVHREDDVTVDVEGGRALARDIPGARLVELPGDDHIPWAGDGDRVLQEMERFLTGSSRVAEHDRVLSTLLFTDIAGSTERAESLDDARWRDVIARHDATVREAVTRFRGSFVKSTGDGALARFDGPARAVRCALAIRDAVGSQGLPIRSGVHTGEVHLTPDHDVRGISVHVAARIMSRAPAHGIYVSRTVRDLVAGSGLRFQRGGSHRLKGVPGRWQLYEVTGLRPQ
ncbi:MAG: adenylate/guanylate cyclase domain-containing protein [Planctomycetota bacterium]